MTSSPHSLTVPMVTAAAIAAAKSYGDDPVAAFDPTSARRLRRSMTAAADALQIFTGQPVKVVCRLVQVLDTTLHHARKYGSAEFTAASAAAMAALAAFGDAYVPPPEPPKPPRSPRRAPRPKEEPVVEAVSTPPARVITDNGGSALTAFPTPARSPLPARKPPRARGSGYSAYGRATTVRLKPVEGRRLRFCERFLRAGWTVEETAFLFDVHPDALAIATRLAAA